MLLVLSVFPLCPFKMGEYNIWQYQKYCVQNKKQMRNLHPSVLICTNFNEPGTNLKDPPFIPPGPKKDCTAQTAYSAYSTREDMDPGGGGKDSD